MKIEELKFECLTELDNKTVGKFIEKCARNCYKSEGSVTEDSYNRIIKNVLLANGHESMLEHFNITFKLTTDLHSYKDLTRHRHASFAIESTRWCNYSKNKELAFIEPYGLKKQLNAYNVWKKACEQTSTDYNMMINMGATIDQASQVLNQSIKADVIITANIREWRYILKLRTAKSVYPNLRFLMIQVLKYLQEKLPVFFDDIEYEEMEKVQAPEEGQLSILEKFKKLKNLKKSEKKSESEPKQLSLLDMSEAEKPSGDDNTIQKKAHDLAVKIFQFRRTKDSIIGVKESPELAAWILKHYSNDLDKIRFIETVIEKDLVGNKKNRNYFYKLSLASTGTLDLMITRDDCGVSRKKLKAYYNKHKDEFPNLKEPLYKGQTIRFEGNAG